MGKLCSKFGKDRSTNNVTFLSTDAGPTDGRLRDFIFSPMHTHCIGQEITGETKKPAYEIKLDAVARLPNISSDCLLLRARCLHRII